MMPSDLKPTSTMTSSRPTARTRPLTTSPSLISEMVYWYVASIGVVFGGEFFVVEIGGVDLLFLGDRSHSGPGSPSSAWRGTWSCGSFRRPDLRSNLGDLSLGTSAWGRVLDRQSCVRGRVRLGGCAFGLFGSAVGLVVVVLVGTSVDPPKYISVRPRGRLLPKQKAL